jgi:hypothetical protein
VGRAAAARDGGGLPLGAEGLGRLPGRATVSRLIDAAVQTLEDSVLPRPLARFPQNGEDDLRVREIEGEIDSASVLVLVENFLERAAAVSRAEDAALGIRTVWMSENRDEDAVRVLRINDDRGDLLPVAEAEVLPGFPSVG